jgi:hypothetical protein
MSDRDMTTPTDAVPRRAAPSRAVVHLRYCRLLTSVDTFALEFGTEKYLLRFRDAQFPDQKGYIVERIGDGPVGVDFLLWLSVYIGEDALDPFQEIDTRFVWHRGDFYLDKSDMQRFMAAAYKATTRKSPNWKRELFSNATLYFSAAIRSGVNMMPLNLGMFALSMECLGNARYGNSSKYSTFGERPFARMLSVRLAPLKQDPARKVDIRAFEKRLNLDIDLMHMLRNAFYGHSLLHRKPDRRKLLDALINWSMRNGHNVKFARVSFQSRRLRDDIIRESFGLYKLGLRLNRLFLFLALGFSRSIPFATHDWQILGDHRDGEESEYRGIKMSFSSSSTKSSDTKQGVATSA